MTATHQVVLASPLGPLGLRLDAAGCLTSVDFLAPGHPLLPPTSAPARRIAEALAAYFKDPEYRFDLPLSPAGTSYQQQVWNALSHIPAGQTRCYGDIAAQLRSAPRAVGQACRRNPIPIVVPCHRVIARAGAGGYSGARSGPEMDIKFWLLRHEGVTLPASPP